MSKIRYVTLAISLLVLVLYMHFSEGFVAVFNVLKNLNHKYFVIALLLVFVGNLIDAFIKHYLRKRYQKCPYHWTLYANLFQIVPSNLIPSILQAGTAVETGIYQKQGLKISQGASLLMVKNISYFSCLCFVCFLLYLSSYSFFIAHTNVLLRVLFAVGYLINFLTILYYIFIGTFDRFLFAIAKFFVNLFDKLGLVKNKEQLLEKLSTELSQLKDSMKNLEYTFKDWFIVCLLTILGLFLGYLVNYFLALSLNCEISVSFWTFCTAICIVSFISVVFPIPGGLGVSDIAYNMLLAPIVGGKINFLLLLWRVATFYFPLLLSSITMMFKVPCNQTNKEENEKDN